MCQTSALSTSITLALQRIGVGCRYSTNILNHYVMHSNKQNSSLLVPTMEVNVEEIMRLWAHDTGSKLGSKRVISYTVKLIHVSISSLFWMMRASKMSHRWTDLTYSCELWQFGSYLGKKESSYVAFCILIDKWWPYERRISQVQTGFQIRHIFYSSG